MSNISIVHIILHMQRMELSHKTSPRAKRITIRIKATGDVIVTRPTWTPKIFAQRFAHSKKDWIEKQTFKLNDQAFLTNEERESLRKQAKKYLPTRTQKFAQDHHLLVGKISIRNQSTRWWSCSSNNNISLNCELMKLPYDLCDYVILHELAHVKHKNHSKDFWNYLESICPDSKKKDKALKKYSLGKK